jgi:hypothetical protein
VPGEIERGSCHTQATRRNRRGEKRPQSAHEWERRPCVQPGGRDDARIRQRMGRRIISGGPPPKNPSPRLTVKRVGLPCRGTNSHKARRNSARKKWTSIRGIFSTYRQDSAHQSRSRSHHIGEGLAKPQINFSPHRSGGEDHLNSRRIKCLRVRHILCFRVQRILPRTRQSGRIWTAAETAAE